MAPKVTSSSNRNRRGSKPVTKGQNPQRSNRQAVSTAQVTSGSNGKPSGGGARVTNASQRTSNGSTRVTGGSKPALPPGKPRPVRPSIGNVSGPATTPKAPGTNASLRPGASRTAPSIPKPAAPAARPNPRAGRLLGRGGAATMGLGLVSAIQDQFLSKEQLDKKYVNDKGKVYNEVRQNLFGKDKPKPTQGNYQSRFSGARESNLNRINNDSRYSDSGSKPKPVAPLPASVRQSSSGGSGSSTPRKSGSTSPARKASAASTATTERRVSASTANRESGNYGTSKTNNPLMKDLVGRIKDREDRDQSSKASKLTSKFNTESNFGGEKVDGSKVNTKAKINSTTSEYDKKKRRYGG